MVSNHGIVQKKIYFTDDSVVKHIKWWNLSNKLDQNNNVYVWNFLAAKVKRMKDYTKPYIPEENPDHIILHVGTNQLDSEK